MDAPAHPASLSVVKVSSLRRRPAPRRRLRPRGPEVASIVPDQ